MLYSYFFIYKYSVYSYSMAFHHLQIGCLYVLLYMLISNKRQMGFCLKRKCNALTHYVFTYIYLRQCFNQRQYKYLYIPNAYNKRNSIIIYTLQCIKVTFHRYSYGLFYILLYSETSSLTAAPVALLYLYESFTIRSSKYVILVWSRPTVV